AIKLWVAATPPEIDAHVAADAPTRLLKPLHECRETPLSLRILCRKVHEHADTAHLLALLRARRERPCRRAADNGDEFPPPHGAYPKAKDHGAKYSRSCSRSVARIAIKSGPLMSGEEVDALIAVLRISSTN